MRSRNFQDRLTTASLLLDDLPLDTPFLTKDLSHVLGVSDPTLQERSREDILETQSNVEKGLDLLTKIETTVARLREALEERRIECQMSIAPIYSLPPEILARTFEWIMTPDASRDLLWQTSNLAQRSSLLKVSKQWRSIVLNHPALWACQVFDVNFLYSRARRRFTKAGNLPLWAMITSYSDTHLSSWHFQNTFDRDTILDPLWISRLQNLFLLGHDILCKDLIAVLSALCPGGILPELKELTIFSTPHRNCNECQTSAVAAPKLRVLRASHPSLESISVWGDVLDLRSSDPCKLTSIRLANIQELTRSDLKSMLEKATRLETLSLGNIRMINSGNQTLEGPGTDGSVNRICLPSLLSLHLGATDVPDFLFLLRNIHAPGLKTLGVDGRSCDVDDELEDHSAESYEAVVVLIQQQVSQNCIPKIYAFNSQ